MHMDWLSVVGGRIKSDFRYSKDVVYNNFVFPPIDEKAQQKLTELGSKILDARKLHPLEPMANLYDPVLMPLALRKAHAAVDEFVEKLYRVEPFEGLEDRFRHLLGLHKAVSELECGRQNVRRGQLMGDDFIPIAD